MTYPSSRSSAVKQCYFCNNGVKYIDYKEVELLRRFTDIHARIQSHNRSGLCAKHQRKLATAIKRARMLSLMPFIAS